MNKEQMHDKQFICVYGNSKTRLQAIADVFTPNFCYQNAVHQQALAAHKLSCLLVIGVC